MRSAVRIDTVSSGCSPSCSYAVSAGRLATRVLRGAPLIAPRTQESARPALRTRALDNDKKAQQSPSSEPVAPPPSGAPAPGAAPPSEAEELKQLWESVKEQMKPGLRQEEVKVLEAIKVDDLTANSTEDLMRRVADEQLGPLLASLGVTEDPLAFFVDLLRLATALQLATAAVVFYGAELGMHMDAGEAFRCTSGLAIGYLSRPFFQVEQLVWPVYDWALKQIAPGAVYEVESSAELRQAVLNKLGVAVAAATLLPQLLWGWDAATCVQLVVPLAAGWFLFDVCYMAALLYKLQL